MAEALSEEVRNNLKTYALNTIGTINCLDCGYDGIMGVVPKSKKVPWYFTWYVIILLIISGIGLIPAAIFGFCRGRCQMHQVGCPKCGSILPHRRLPRN